MVLSLEDRLENMAANTTLFKLAAYMKYTYVCKYFWKNSELKICEIGIIRHMFLGFPAGDLLTIQLVSLQPEVPDYTEYIDNIGENLLKIFQIKIFR